LSPSLLRAELFGHTRGAFTGSTGARDGLIDAAGDGTLVLDEIGALGPAGQSAVLQLLDDGEYRRIGDPRVRTLGARLIAATLRPDALREDLRQRLSALHLEVPPLRMRRGDIVPIARASVASDRDCSALAPRGGWRMTRECEGELARRDWPGNVRDLHAALRSAALSAHVAGSTVLDAEHLPSPGADSVISARLLARQNRVSIRTAQRALRSAEAQGLVVRCGAGRSTRWRVPVANGAIVSRLCRDS
jgi:DNA-binding NtrC family response regulator